MLPWCHQPCSFLFKVTLTTLGLLCFPVTFRVIFSGVMGNVTGIQKVGSTWSQEWFAISKLIPHDLLLNEANERHINVTEFRTHHIRSAFTVDCERGCNRRAFCLPRHKMLSSSEYKGRNADRITLYWVCNCYLNNKETALALPSQVKMKTQENCHGFCGTAIGFRKVTGIVFLQP